MGTDGTARDREALEKREKRLGASAQEALARLRVLVERMPSPGAPGPGA